MRRLIQRRLRPSDKSSLRRMFDPSKYELDTATGRVKEKTAGPVIVPLDEPISFENTLSKTLVINGSKLWTTFPGLGYYPVFNYTYNGTTKTMYFNGGSLYEKSGDDYNYSYEIQVTGSTSTGLYYAVPEVNPLTIDAWIGEEYLSIKENTPIRTIDSTSGYYEFDYTTAATRIPYAMSFTILKTLVNDKAVSVVISRSGAIQSSTYFTATKSDGKVKLTVNAGYTVNVYTESLTDYLTWNPAS